MSMKSGVMSNSVTVKRDDKPNSGTLQRGMPITQIPGFDAVNAGPVRQMPIRVGGVTGVVAPPSTGSDPNFMPRAGGGQKTMPAKDQYDPK